MANVAITAGGFRAVAHDPEDTLTFDAASGYTPVEGDLVAISGNDEVDGCDATTANALDEPIGVVLSVQSIRNNAGAAAYRVTVLLRGLVEGFTGLTAKTVLYTSATSERIEDADPTASGIIGRPVGVAVNATSVFIALPQFGT